MTVSKVVVTGDGMYEELIPESLPEIPIRTISPIAISSPAIKSTDGAPTAAAAQAGVPTIAEPA